MEHEVVVPTVDTEHITSKSFIIQHLKSLRVKMCFGKCASDFKSKIFYFLCKKDFTHFLKSFISGKKIC